METLGDALPPPTGTTLLPPLRGETPLCRKGGARIGKWERAK